MQSLNSPQVHQVICHGIPDDRILLDGDVVKIDVSVCAPSHMAFKRTELLTAPLAVL
jgi:hypothetical protein